MRLRDYRQCAAEKEGKILEQPPSRLALATAGLRI